MWKLIAACSKVYCTKHEKGYYQMHDYNSSWLLNNLSQIPVKSLGNASHRPNMKERLLVALDGSMAVI